MSGNLLRDNSAPRPDLPAATATNFNQRLRETVMTYLGRQGDPLSRGVTLRDLVVTGFARLPVGFDPSNIGPRTPPLIPGVVIPAPYEPDLAPPPTPTGFTVSAAISNIFIEHDSPIFTQGHGYLRTNVYAAIYTGGALPTFSAAVRITQFTGNVFAHATNPSTTLRVWVKWESKDGVESAAPAGGTNGLAVTTGSDVSSMVRAMTGPGNPFTILAVDTVIGGVTFPAGTYSTKAFIIDAQITNAKIADAAIDNAKIANLSASKIRSGTIQVGEQIKSTGYVAGSFGWAIDGNGNIEATNAVIRGGIFATYGVIGGNNISGTGISSPNYDGFAGWAVNSAGAAFFGNIFARGEINVGSFVDFNWPASGTGAHLSSIGLRLGRPSSGRYLELTAAGNMYAPNFSLVDGVLTINGSGTFSGVLSAASGSFTGSLTAASAQVGTLNIEGNAVTVPVGASGTPSASVTMTCVASQGVFITAVGSGTGNSSSLLILYINDVEVWREAAPGVVTAVSGGDASSSVTYTYSAMPLTIHYLFFPSSAGAYTFRVTSLVDSRVTLYAVQTKR